MTEKQKQLDYAKKLFIYGGVTKQVDLEEKSGVSRQTLTKYIKQWEVERDSLLITPQRQAEVIQESMTNLLLEIRRLQREKTFVAPLLYKQMRELRSLLESIGSSYDYKGTMMEWSNTFTDFILERPNDRDLITRLTTIMPDFWAYMEAKEKKRSR